MANNTAGCVQMMRALSEALFYAQDLKLYLDTHPCDTNALRMFREAVRRAKSLAAGFEEKFYPLTDYSAGEDDNWDWLCGIWPSQKMM